MKKCPLSEVCVITMGQSPDSNTYNTEGNGLPFFQGCADFGQYHPNVTTWCSTPNKIAQPNDILMSVRAPIGTLNIADVKCCIGRGLASFRAIPGKTISKFLYYFLKASEGYLQEQGTGAIFKAIGKSSLINCPIYLPTIDVQQRIVDELDLLTGVIEKKNEQLKTLVKLAESTFFEMFGDPIENNKGWNLVSINDCVEEMFLGPFGSALKTDCYVPKESSYCMVYEQKHAIKKTLDLETHYINEEKYKSLKRFTVKSGDIIMSCRGTIGEIFELPKNAPIGIIHPSLMKIRLKDGVLTREFFKVVLKKIVGQQEMNGGVVKMAITAKMLGQIKIIAPPIEIQEQYYNRIIAINKIKESISLSLKDAHNILASRMDTYFSE